MQTLDDYHKLDEAGQVDLIVKSHFLADREENRLVVQLYSVGNFYGELYYDPRANKVLRWRAFEGIAQLTPYLAHIRFNS
jgi:hypothetical protein